MDITSLIESAKQLSRQYERNAMNAEVLIEKISGFNQDALALGNSQTSDIEPNLESPCSNGGGGDSGVEELDNEQHHFACTMKRSKAALLQAVQSDSNQLRQLIVCTFITPIQVRAFHELVTDKKLIEKTEI